MKVDPAIETVLFVVESHRVPSCENGFVTAPSLLDDEKAQEGALMSITRIQAAAGADARAGHKPSALARRA